MRTYPRLNLGATPGMVAYNPFNSALPPGITAQQLAVQSIQPAPVPVMSAAPTWTPQAQIVLANQPSTQVTGNASAPTAPSAADLSTGGAMPQAAITSNDWLWLVGGFLVVFLLLDR